MRSLRQAFHSLWDHLNPSEPSPYFLATFFASAMLLFAIAILIGHFQG